MASVRLLYVAGWGRSGSTLLARLLSAHDDVVFVGELRDLWHRGVDEDRPCGCGATFHTCAFWTAVGAAAYGGWDRVDVEHMKQLRAAADRPWTPMALAHGRVPPGRRVAVDAYVQMLDRVVQAVAEVADGRWVVDSSKIPSFAWLLGEVPGIDLRVAHLVRDPRGVVHSWRKEVGGAGQPTYMERYSPLAAVARYDLYNTQAEHLDELGPMIRLRYEDVVADPRLALRRVAGLLDLDDALAAHVDEDPPAADLGPSHSVVGNPMRMTTGRVALRPDTGWHAGLSPGLRRFVSAGTWPLRRRYGYDGRPA